LPFVAAVHMTSIDTGGEIAAHTEDLTLFGCFVETPTPFVDGTKVALRISHYGATVVAQGEVAHSQRVGGMGIHFTSIEPSSIPILESWLAERASPSETEI
jgi:PilZ domain